MGRIQQTGICKTHIVSKVNHSLSDSPHFLQDKEIVIHSNAFTQSSKVKASSFDRHSSLKSSLPCDEIRTTTPKTSSAHSEHKCFSNGISLSRKSSPHTKPFHPCFPLSNNMYSVLHSLHTIFTNCLSLLSQISKISLPQGHFIIPVTSNSLLLLPTGIIISCKCIGIGNIVVTCFFFPNNHIISISYLFVKCKFTFCHVFSSSNFRFIELSIPCFSLKEYPYMKNEVVFPYNYFTRISRNLSPLHTDLAYKV